MIDITRTGNAATVQAAVTEFTDVMGYCEHKLPLLVEGVQVPRPEAVIRGTQAHNLEEAEELERGELVPVTEEKLADPAQEIEFAREDVYTTLETGVDTGKGRVLVRLVGRTDKVVRAGGTLVVSDDKFVKNPSLYENRDLPYPNQILQVLAYLNSDFYSSSSREEILEIPHKEKAWSINIRSSETREITKTFHKTLDARMADMLFGTIERFAKIAVGDEERRHHNNARKCAPCQYAGMCKFVVRD